VTVTKRLVKPQTRDCNVLPTIWCKRDIARKLCRHRRQMALTGIDNPRPLGAKQAPIGSLSGHFRLLTSLDNCCYQVSPCGLPVKVLLVNGVLAACKAVYTCGTLMVSLMVCP
jgi:hypothetical protein